jgi:peptidoglycan-associated lipoprotein
MFRLQLVARLTTLLLAAGLIYGCTPKYPKCDKDEHCRKGEFCINGACQQCRTSKDCPKGEVCKSGKCEAGKDYCETNDDCPEGFCKNNRCVPCDKDADCGDGGRCRNRRCLRPGMCGSDADCPPNYECQGGKCVAPPGLNAGQAKCTPEPIYFDFDEFVLTSDGSSKLQATASCIKSVPDRTIRLEGHFDPRGTEEYNLALGDRRAQAVKTYLQRLGVGEKRMRAISKGKLEAAGSDENSWPKDRKVQFIWE